MLLVPEAAQVERWLRGLPQAQRLGRLARVERILRARHPPSLLDRDLLAAIAAWRLVQQLPGSSTPA